MVFNLPVTGEKVKPHQVTTLHMICALAFIVTGAIIVVYNYTIPLWGAALLISGLLLTVLVIAKNKWVTGKKVNIAFRVAELLIALTIGSYSLWQKWKFPTGIFAALSASLIFSLFWESTAGKQLSVYFDEQGAKLPHPSRRRYRPWTEIDEVIVRFGILTINCVDNTLIQWTIKDPAPDTEIFEAWCMAQVEANKNKRIADW